MSSFSLIFAGDIPYDLCAASEFQVDWLLVKSLNITGNRFDFGDCHFRSDIAHDAVDIIVSVFGLEGL